MDRIEQMNWLMDQAEFTLDKLICFGNIAQ